MSLARLVVMAVKVQGRTKSEVARDYRVSRGWVRELVGRYEREGEAGLEPRSRRPLSSPQRSPVELEDEIVELRKTLSEQGLDAGGHTIAFHLHERHGATPAVSTIWRILSRRGFVTPQPQKRPRSSFIRFEAEMPNERWQADLTHWALADGSPVEILNMIDAGTGFLVPGRYRVRRDRIDPSGVVTLRYKSRLHHIGLGRRHAGTRVLILIADLDVRVLTEDGELLRELQLDPRRDYQPQAKA